MGDVNGEAKKPAKRGAKKVARGKRAQKAGTGQGAPWTFPKHPLERAIVVAQTLEEKNAGKPLGASDLGSMLGFNRVADWRFQELLRSANQYGIISGSGTAATIQLTELGEDIVSPSSSAQRQKALLEAFNKVDQFQRVAAFYAGKRIPEDEYFGNTLIRDFAVPRDRVPTFIEVFTANLAFLKAFAAGAEGAPVLSAVVAQTAGETPASTTTIEPETVREFLDTCFILMPFGDWFDRYYREIYVPSTKEAGFEPLRADSLFSSGSVIEQIWQQIKKAKVLLADLTGRNPNVFYELGLAHALKKPVVFVAGSIDDVPFDVRHLRVVTFDTREPNWAEKLRRDITTYLKNARTEPERSIPQPFRDLADVEPLADVPEVRTRRRKQPADEADA